MKKCPVCGVSVKVENLERHVRNQHPRAQVEREQILTEAERTEVHRSAPRTRPAMTRRGKMIAAAVAIVLIIVIVALAFRPNVGLSVGQIAPDFTATTSDDGTVHLNSLRGRPVFLEFMDVDCIHCLNEAQNVLPTLYATYSSRVTFLSVDVDILGSPDTKDRINTFRTQTGNSWTFVLPNAPITQSYGITSTPTMYVLDRNGVIVGAFFGETPYPDLAASLDRALQG